MIRLSRVRMPEEFAACAKIRTSDELQGGVGWGVGRLSPRDMYSQQVTSNNGLDVEKLRLDS